MNKRNGRDRNLKASDSVPIKDRQTSSLFPLNPTRNQICSVPIMKNCRTRESRPRANSLPGVGCRSYRTVETTVILNILFGDLFYMTGGNPRKKHHVDCCVSHSCVLQLYLYRFLFQLRKYTAYWYI